MANWYPVMTDAGRAAIQATDGLGLSARITHVALGTGRYAVRGADGSPTNVALNATALTNERLRVPVYAGGSPEPGSLLIVAQVPQAATAGEEFYLSEVGFYDQSGTLLVVWSDLSASMGHRGTLASWNLTLSWAWRDMPSSAITVQVVNAAFSEQLLRTAQGRAKMERLAAEAGVPFSDSDPMVLTQAVNAMVNQAVASLNKVIRKPIAVTPADGATGTLLAPMLRGSTYFSADGYAHTKSQFVVVNQAGAILHDSGEVAASTEYSVPSGLLAVLVTYKWRVRYKGTLGGNTNWSDWSADATFTTASTIVAAPTVLSPATGTINVGAQPTLTSSAFSVLNGTDSHYRTKWQVSTDANFATVTWDSGDVTSLTQIVVPANVLAAATTYHVRVRHIGTVLGQSGWSNAISFTTRNTFVYVAPPSVTSPTNGQAGVSLTPTITMAAFSVIGGADTHQSTQVQVRLASGDWSAPVFDSGEVATTTSVTIAIANALPVDRDCVVRARYRGATTGWSAYSNEVAFRTRVPSGQQLMTAVGTVMFTVPAGVYEVTAEPEGGGGAGGYYNGGAGGGYARKRVAVVPGQQIPVTVGAGGVIGGADSNTPPTAGGTSSFGSYVSATGGQPGEWGKATRAAGGQGVNGDVNFTGGRGGNYVADEAGAQLAAAAAGGGGAAGKDGHGHDGEDAQNDYNPGGQGGDGGGGQAGKGGKGKGGHYANQAATPGQNYGGGGGGGSSNGWISGSAGAQGCVLITW